MLQLEILKRVLNSDAGKKAAAQIGKERNAKRKALNDRAATLRAERNRAAERYDEEFQNAKKRYAGALTEEKNAKAALFSADRKAKRAHQLHGKELRDVQAELTELDSQEAKP